MAVEARLAELERPSLLVTSAVSGEGRTTVAASLARSLALAGQRVVLVDLDVSAPGIHRQVRVPNDIGVVDVLLGRQPADECLHFVQLPSTPAGVARGYYVLTAGNLDDPSALIGGKRTRELLRALESQAGVVVADGPPVLERPDAVTLGRLVGGALLVVTSRLTPTSRAEQAKLELSKHQVKLLGVVLNNRPRRPVPAHLQTSNR